MKNDFRKKSVKLLFFLITILNVFQIKINVYATNLDIKLPTYAEREIINVEKKIENLTNENNNVSFGFITDIHGGQDLLSTYANINSFRKIGMNSNINFSVFAGDITASSNFNSGKVLYDLEYYSKQLKDTKAPVLFVRGNHDCNKREDESVAIPGKQYYDSVLADLQGAHFNEYDLEGNYYYKDLENEKIRIGILNAFNGSNYEFIFGNKQLDFIKNEMLDFTDKSNPEEWHILFITHTVDETSAHKEVPSDNEKLYKILNEFQRKKGTVIGIITGHHHLDSTKIKNNILIITVRSASIFFDREGKKEEAFDESDLSFGIFTIDKHNKVLYETKVGRGKDRKWNYDINNLKEESIQDKTNNIDIPTKDESIKFNTFVNSNNQLVAFATSNEEFLEEPEKTWKLSKDKKTYVKALGNIDKNYSETFTDKNGNKNTFKIRIDNFIDLEPPKLDLKYITNADGTVTAEIKSNEILRDKTNKNWLLDANRRTYKYIFTLNKQNYKTTFTDVFGNSTSITLNAEIFKPKIQYIKNDSTKTVKAIVTSTTVKFKDTKPTWKLSEDGYTYTKTFTKNENYSTVFTDIYGNSIKMEIKTESSNPSMIVKLENKINDNGTVSIIAKSNNKFKNTKPTWKLSEDGYTYTKTFTKNENYYTTFTDIYGNNVKQNIQINISN